MHVLDQGGRLVLILEAANSPINLQDDLWNSSVIVRKVLSEKKLRAGLHLVAGIKAFAPFHFPQPTFYNELLLLIIIPLKKKGGKAGTSGKALIRFDPWLACD